MSRNITIPLSLFYKIFDLLDCWDVSEYSPHIRVDYCDVLFALSKKKQSIELRQAYSKIINADSDDERHNARMLYLLEKRNLKDYF
jgi:hypothetical protein